MLQSNISYWLEIDKKIPPKYESILIARDATAKELKHQEIELSKNRQNLSHDEQILKSKLIKALQQKTSSLSHWVEDISNQRWWIAQHLRGNYRRLSILKRK